MKLYSFQPPEVYDALCAQGVLYTDPAKIKMLYDEEWSSLFRKPYEWVKEKMSSTAGYEGNYPWWSYFKASSDKARPDLRIHRHYHHTQMYLLELEVPDDEVLLIPYGPWSIMLNHRPVYYTWEDDDACTFDVVKDQDAILKTWDRALDLDTVLKSELWGPDAIQGCFEKLRLENVVKATKFMGAYKGKHD